MMRQGRNATLIKMTADVVEAKRVAVQLTSADILSIPEELADTDTNRKPILIRFPVRDEEDVCHDALAILKKSKRHPASHPAKLIFDQDKADAIHEEMKDLLLNETYDFHFQLESELKTQIARAAGLGDDTDEIRQIKSLATYLNIEIVHTTASSTEHSIAVPKNLPFGFRNIWGMCGTIGAITITQSFSSLFNSNSIDVMNFVSLPIFGYAQCKQTFMPSYNWKTRLYSFNHVSLPNILLNSAAGAAMYVGNASLKAYFTEGMSDSAAHAVSFFLPYGTLAAFSATVYYGPRLVNTIVETGVSMRDCAYSACSMLKSCGMRLWRGKANQAIEQPSAQLSQALLQA